LPHQSSSKIIGVADLWNKFVCGTKAPTHKFIPPLSNVESSQPITKVVRQSIQQSNRFNKAAQGDETMAPPLSIPSPKIL
jgi:hypothetical protein